MEYKPWMLNDKMWESGVKANKWINAKSGYLFMWLANRQPDRRQDKELEFFDFTHSILFQKETGWN